MPNHPFTYLKSITLLLGVLIFSESLAQRFILPPSDTDLIGEIRSVKAQNEDTLLDIARRFDIGQERNSACKPRR